ncbi:MAG: DUF3380 domain-containing protein [Caldilineaceae bacterium]|nr:DUF3380 domain-containing protein [Caldilineaceae bacterium]
MATEKDKPAHPLPSGTPRPDSSFTNQQIIDAFYTAAHRRALDDWALLEKAGLDLVQLAQAREARYAGPPVDQIETLNEEERDLVLAELAGAGLVHLPRVGHVTAPAGLNLRSGPDGDEAILARLPLGQRLEIEVEAGEWLRVTATGGENDGRQGFVHGDFVQAGEPPEEREDESPTAKPDSTNAFFTHDATLRTVAMEPDADQQVRLASDAGDGARRLAAVWAQTGGLLTVLAARLGIAPGAALAVLAVESGGSGFGEDGRMIIRFENHLFFHYWGQSEPARFAQHFRFDAERQWEGHEWRADTYVPFRTFHGVQPQEWEVFGFAQGLNDGAAKRAISMGAAQILGSNYARLGYAGADEMFGAMSRDLRTQILALFDFIRTDPSLVQALRDRDYTRFAQGYNGPGMAQRYGELIAQWVAAFQRLAPPPSDVAALPRPLETQALDPTLDQALTIVPVTYNPEVHMQVTSPNTAQAVRAASDDAPPEPLQLPLHDAPPEISDQVQAIWLEHVREGFQNNSVMFRRILRAFMIPYYLTVALYVLLFVVGLGLFLLAARLSVQEGNTVAAVLFGGLGVVAFLAFFIRQPMRALEENLQFITWLGIIYNSYWTRLLYMQDGETVQADMEDVTQDAVKQIEQMLARNAELAGRRPGGENQ